MIPDEPLLECVEVEGFGAKCDCYREYSKEQESLYEDGPANYTACRIKIGHKCNPISEVKCVAKTYCDNEFGNCTCKTQQTNCVRESDWIDSGGSPTFTLNICGGFGVWFIWISYFANKVFYNMLHCK